jgi:23S rRNA pseudouridine1911/1915/1917 synthase
MDLSSLDVLYADNHLLVVNKPAGLVTQGAVPGTDSLHTQAAAFLKELGGKSGKAYVGIVSRLDVGTSGAIVLARTSKAAARLTEQYRAGTVQKTYWAVVAGHFPGSITELSGHMTSVPDGYAMRMCVANTPHAQTCHLLISNVISDREVSLLVVEPRTGRKHQIRVQLADRGFPILGDRRYGSDRPWPRGIALHARAITIAHPTRGDRMQFIAPPPRNWFRACRSYPAIQQFLEQP